MAQIQITRISDAATWGNSTSGLPINNWGPTYPQIHAWSSGDKWIMLQAIRTANGGGYQSQHGNTGLHLLDGTTGAYQGPMRSADGSVGVRIGNARWLNNEPDILLCQTSNDASPYPPNLEQYNVVTKAFSMWRDFAPDGYAELSRNLNGEKGNQSQDDRYWAVGIKSNAGQWQVICYDRQQDAVVGAVSCDAEPGLGNIRSYGMSWSGEYIWVANSAAASIGGATRAAGVHIFGNDGSYQRSITSTPNTYNHNGAGRTANGKDVWVFLGSSDPVGNPNERAIVSAPMDGSPWRVEVPSGILNDTKYVSALNEGYALHSDFAQATGNAAGVPEPHRGLATLIRLDGTGTIYPVASLRFPVEDHSPAATYYSLPWAVMSRDSTRCLYKSPMILTAAGYSPSMDFHAYISEIAP